MACAREFSTAPNGGARMRVSRVPARPSRSGPFSSTRFRVYTFKDINQGVIRFGPTRRSCFPVFLSLLSLSPRRISRFSARFAKCHPVRTDKTVLRRLAGRSAKTGGPRAPIRRIRKFRFSIWSDRTFPADSDWIIYISILNHQINTDGGGGGRKIYKIPSTSPLLAGDTPPVYDTARRSAPISSCRVFRLSPWLYIIIIYYDFEHRFVVKSPSRVFGRIKRIFPRR